MKKKTKENYIRRINYLRSAVKKINFCVNYTVMFVKIICLVSFSE